MFEPIRPTHEPIPRADELPSALSAEGPDVCGDYNILSADEPGAVAAVIGSGFVHPQKAAALARLIAAAPDLLDALEQADGLLEHEQRCRDYRLADRYGYCVCIKETIRLAIQKAKEV